MNILGLIVALIVLVIVVAIVWFFMTRYAIPLINRLPDPFNQIIVFLVVLGLVVLLIFILLGLVGIGPGIGIRL